MRSAVLGCPVDVVDESSAVDALVALVERRRNDPTQPGGLVVTLNPEMVMRARRDPEFRATLDTAALLVPDGIGVVRALRRRGHPHATRVGGADMLMAYLPEAVRRHHRVAIAGAGPGVAAVAGQRLRAQFPGLEIVATDSGDPDDALARRLQDVQPDMVWAAFGAGKQERFLRRHLALIGAGAGVGVGGTLDYIAGRVPRAPRAVRNAGLEWAWRLAREPWRLRRQVQLPRFWMLERAEAHRRRRAL